MKILDSFRVDNAEGHFIVRLVQFDTVFVFPPKRIYVVHQEKTNLFRYIYFTKFFATRKYNQIKNSYKSCWLEYCVHEVGGGNQKNDYT